MMRRAASPLTFQRISNMFLAIVAQGIDKAIKQPPSVSIGKIMRRQI
jgi:hypothetical protein